MSSVEDRRVAAVVGALVADAAAQPLHWNYKQEKLNSLIEGLDEIAFREQSANPFYSIKTGKQSCYGDQTYCILKSLIENNGLDVKALQKSTYDMFGPESEYENEVNKVYKSKTDKNPQLPIHSPWRHFSIKDFIRNYDKKLEITGSETDKQVDCILRAIPVAALFAGRSDMLDHVEDVLRVTQNNDLCVVIGLAAARLLEHYILYGKDDNALEEVIRQLSDQNRRNPQDLDKAMAGMLRQVVTKKTVDHYTAAKELLIPGSFQSAVHGVITATNYPDGVQSTMRAGGCSCSRGGFIGACMAAQHGLESIPATWKEKTIRYQEYLELSQKLIHITLD